MPRIQLETGQILEFENDPTLDDIDAAVSQLSHSKLPQKIGEEKDIRSSKMIPQFTKGLYENLPFGKRIVGMLPNAEKIEEQMETTPRPKGFLPSFARGAGATAPDLAMSAPFMGGAGLIPKIPAIAKAAIGFGAYGGVKAAAQGENIPQKALESGASAALFHGAGKLGASLIPKVLPFAERIGSAIGGGATGRMIGGEEGMALGAGLGALYPAQRISKSPTKLAKEATEAYRNILRPNQGEVKNIEIRKGKNIDDYYRLAAEEQLPIKQTSDKKLDTSLARQKLQPKIEEIHNQLNSFLETRQNKFNLKNLAVRVKLELSKSIKNAKELKDMKTEVDNYVNAEIERYGTNEVLPSDFNNVKQGMWSLAYDPLKPTSNATARKIGFVAKEMIEGAYPNKNIKELNELSGKYQTLNNLLENAQGRVIQGGRLGGYFAKTIGAVAGSKIPIIGPLAGAYVGNKVNEAIYAPERVSKIASKKAQKAGIVGQSFQEKVVK